MNVIVVLQSGKTVTGDAGTSSITLTNNISPANKRRSTFRKWLTNPVRKLSHGKLEKTGPEGALPAPPAIINKVANKKPSSSHKWKLISHSEEMGNRPGNLQPSASHSMDESITSRVEDLVISTSSHPLSAAVPSSQSPEPNTDEDDVPPDVEIPPPMEIQERISCPPLSNVGCASNSNCDDTSINREQHSEKVSEPDILNEQAVVLPADNNIDDKSDGSQGEDTENEKKYIEKRKFVLHELVDTERDYVRDLGLIVDGYMRATEDEDSEIQMPEDLKEGKNKIVFGNIEAMYEWHRDFFLSELEKCLEEPERLGMLFKRCERRLQMYVVYCQNKSKSEYIVSEFIDSYYEEIRQKRKHKLQLPDLLIKPVQRIMKYQLLLKDIRKFTERAGLVQEVADLDKAVQVMHVVPKMANDMMNVGRLQGFDGKITAQGKLMKQGLLSISDLPLTGRLKERQVFLFEQIIIVSETVGPKSQFSNPVYIYKNHLQVNKMALEEKTEDQDPSKFILRSKTPGRTNEGFICQGTTKEERDHWVASIRAILDTQLDFLRALQSPIAYQKELNKDISPEAGSLWNPSLRKTLSHPAAAHKIVKGEGTEGSKVGRGLSSRTKKSRDGATVPTSSTQSNSDVTAKITSLPCSPTDRGESVLSSSSSNKDVDSSTDVKHSSPASLRSPVSSPPLSGSPPKCKKNFFDGFRNTLRPKSPKNDQSSSSIGDNVASRRWSDSNSQKQSPVRPSSVSDISDVPE